jgi:two-component system nitrogen regulation response regulator NtrX
MNGEITGSSPAIEKVRERIRQAAPSDSRVLISGENGTGKELAALEIHRLSPRGTGPFVAVNCAAIPDTLIESELFGHEKGAFTGAVSFRPGKFESASGGTLFLDEVGDLSPGAQAKLLRAIQEGVVERLGSAVSVKVDVRVVAATNKDLSEECGRGRFREDLFFRLNVIPLFIPPLRERKQDILVLLGAFLADLGAGAHFDAGAETLLLAYDWPGNIRELRNLAERIAVMRPGPDSIGAPELQELLVMRGGRKKEVSSADKLNGDLRNSLDLSYNKAKGIFEKLYLAYQYGKNGGSLPKTAEATGIVPGSLAAKLKKFGISSLSGDILR